MGSALSLTNVGSSTHQSSWTASRLGSQLEQINQDASSIPRESLSGLTTSSGERKGASKLIKRSIAANGDDRPAKRFKTANVRVVDDPVTVTTATSDVKVPRDHETIKNAPSAVKVVSVMETAERASSNPSALNNMVMVKTEPVDHDESSESSPSQSSDDGIQEATSQAIASGTQIQHKATKATKANKINKAKQRSKKFKLTWTEQMERALIIRLIHCGAENVKKYQAWELAASAVKEVAPVQLRRNITTSRCHGRYDQFSHMYAAYKMMRDRQNGWRLTHKGIPWNVDSAVEKLYFEANIDARVLQQSGLPYKDLLCNLFEGVESRKKIKAAKNSSAAASARIGIARSFDSEATSTVDNATPKGPRAPSRISRSKARALLSGAAASPHQGSPANLVKAQDAHNPALHSSPTTAMRRPASKSHLAHAANDAAMTSSVSPGGDHAVIEPTSSSASGFAILGAAAHPTNDAMSLNQLSVDRFSASRVVFPGTTMRATIKAARDEDNATMKETRTVRPSPPPAAPFAPFAFSQQPTLATDREVRVRLPPPAGVVNESESHACVTASVMPTSGSDDNAGATQTNDMSSPHGTPSVATLISIEPPKAADDDAATLVPGSDVDTVTKDPDVCTSLVNLPMANNTLAVQSEHVASQPLSAESAPIRTWPSLVAEAFWKHADEFPLMTMVIVSDKLQKESAAQFFLHAPYEHQRGLIQYYIEEDERSSRLLQDGRPAVDRAV